MKEIVFATNNAHKLKEFRSMLGKDWHVLSLADIGCHDDIPETADTFEGNALQKAMFVAERYGRCNVVADDSGALASTHSMVRLEYSAQDMRAKGTTPKPTMPACLLNSMESPTDMPIWPQPWCFLPMRPASR